MKLLLIIIPFVFILVDAVYNCLKLPNFWQKVDLGRRFSLLATSTSFIALVHFHFSALNKTEPLIKLFQEEISFFFYIGATFVAFTLLSFWDLYLELHGNITRDLQGKTFRVPKKYKSKLEDFSLHFVVYVITSLFVGITTILSIVFLYCYERGDWGLCAMKFLRQFGMWVYFGIALLFSAFIMWSLKYRGCISSPEYDRSRHAMEVID